MEILSKSIEVLESQEEYVINFTYFDLRVQNKDEGEKFLDELEALCKKYAKEDWLFEYDCEGW